MHCILSFIAGYNVEEICLSLVRVNIYRLRAFSTGNNEVSCTQILYGSVYSSHRKTPQSLFLNSLTCPSKNKNAHNRVHSF